MSSSNTKDPVPRQRPVLAKRGKSLTSKGKTKRPKEIGGPPGPEPTRYGDWERNGRCSDF